MSTAERGEKLARVEALTCQLQDGLIDDAGRRELNDLLFGDPGACERYLDLMTLHGHLHRQLGGGGATAFRPPGDVAPPAPARPGARRLRLPAPMRLAWAAVILLAAALALSLRFRSGRSVIGPAPAPADATIATVERLDQARWHDGPTPAAGERLGPATVNLAAGTAVIRFDTGAVATLTGPAELRLESARAAELRSGTVVVRCTADAVGFTLRTAASDFVDLGTEFGVSVNADHSSDVHVFEGVVIARPRSSDAVVPVLRNEAGRVEVDRGDLLTIPPDRSRFPGVTAGLQTPQAATPARALYAPLARDARVIFLGDQATDGETHLLLIKQALGRAHPLPAPGGTPLLFDAGTALPLSFGEDEYARLVSPFRPTHAVLEFGPEIAAAPEPRTADAFEAAVVRLLDRLRKDGIEPIIETGFPLAPRVAHRQPLLDAYNTSLRKLAAARGLRLADADVHFRAAGPDAGTSHLVAERGAVPTFAGYQELAAVVLETFGYAGLTVDSTVDVSPLPGVVTEWHVRGKPASERLTDARAASLEPRPDWKRVTLPQPEDLFAARLADASQSVTYRDRSRGFATSLYFGKDRMLEGVAWVDSDREKDVFIGTGATLRKVWVNGQPVFESHGWTGWHAGKERVPARLKAGKNRIVIEATSSFFLNVTDRIDWPVQ